MEGLSYTLNQRPDLQGHGDSCLVHWGVMGDMMSIYQSLKSVVLAIVLDLIYYLLCYAVHLWPQW